MTDISDWIICLLGQRSLLGKPGGEPSARSSALTGGHLGQTVTLGLHPPNSLSPVYDLIRMPSPNGIVQIVAPVNWHPVESLPLPADAVTYTVESLPSDEKRALRQAVAKAEEIFRQMKAGGSSIAIVPASGMPKEPAR